MNWRIGQLPNYAPTRPPPWVGHYIATLDHRLLERQKRDQPIQILAKSSNTCFEIVLSLVALGSTDDLDAFARPFFAASWSDFDMDLILFSGQIGLTAPTGASSLSCESTGSLEHFGDTGFGRASIQRFRNLRMLQRAAMIYRHF